MTTEPDPGPAQHLSRLTDMRDRGVLTEQEFQAVKGRLLGAEAPAGLAAPAPTKTTNSGVGWFWPAAGALGVLVLIAGGYALSGSADDSTTTSTQPLFTAAPPPKVVYEVEGSASTASLTLQSPTGTSQLDADLPLTNSTGGKGLTLTGFSTGDFVYVSAQNQDEYGTVTCRITVNGAVVSENSASGAYVIATCQGQA